MSDPFFGEPTLDKDEWRDAPFRHRFVHGQFGGTDTHFVFWFPPKDAWRGRSLQFLQGGMGGSEHQGQTVGQPWLSRDLGAYYVESNQGHIGNDLKGLKGDNTILAWRASAATARLGVAMASEMYGAAPHHNYVYGGSGGAMRAIECLEACPDVWDGAVPFMVNRSPLMFLNWSIAAWAGNVLAEKLSAVVDATDAGGSGNPFAVLATDAEKQALAALYRAGFCRGAEPQLDPNPLWILGMDLLAANDRAYYREFWETKGYEGADRDPLPQALLLDEPTKVARVLTARELQAALPAGGLNAQVLGRMDAAGVAAIEVESPHADRYLGASIHVESGKANGRVLRCSQTLQGKLMAMFDVAGFAGMAPGDHLRLENRDLVAFCYYHRHLTDLRYPAMRQFFVDGAPIYAQRSKDFDRIPVPKGAFQGKMILLQHGTDRECWPNCAQPYIEDVRRNLGETTSDRFRIYWVENAAHLVPTEKRGLTRLLNYAGTYQQAVRDLVAWVENGEPPPPSTEYRLDDATGRLELPTDAQTRRGLQPTVTASANGAARADVRAGEPVSLRVTAEAPAGAGGFVQVEWDFDGSGDFAARETLDGQSASLEHAVSHAWEQPGTYFATARVTLNRSGDPADRIGRITNLARTRVVVA